MNFLRTISALLYLLMMVLLPHAHLAAHGHECESGHTADQTQTLQDDCPLCQLLALPVETGHTRVAVVSTAALNETVVYHPDGFISLFPIPRLARAPPFMTA